MKNTLMLSNGIRILKRYRKGRCYAAAFAADTTDWQIIAAMSQGDACFFPFNESTGEFMFGKTNRPSRFRR